MYTYYILDVLDMLYYIKGYRRMLLELSQRALESLKHVVRSGCVASTPLTFISFSPTKKLM